MSSRFQSLVDKLPALAARPSIRLHEQATDLHELKRMGDRLGIRLDIKRDDTLPLAMGGNKVRQLEYYLGPAAEIGADTVLITGAVQSNFVRLCAAACRLQGWHPIVQLEDRVPKDDHPYNTSGNVLLDRMLGAEIVRFAEGENEAAADANLDRIAEERRSRGKTPYVIHLGIDHPPHGGMGYAAAAVETFLQYEALGYMPDHVVIPSGSGLTHAGFLAGARAVGWDVNVLGICVRRSADLQQQRIERRAQEISAWLEGDLPVRAADVNVDDTVLAPGYGRMNPEVAEAMDLAARDEAILLDPVYSGRCFAGLIQHVRSGTIKTGDRVAFIHTGGAPAIFAYQNDITTHVLAGSN